MLSKDPFLNWHVVYTMPNAEKKINLELQKRGVETFLPLVSKVVQWSDRKKKLETPLFPGYLFVKPFDMGQTREVVRVNGVIKFLTSEGKLDVVPDSEIDIIRRLLVGSPEVTARDFEVGQEVEITSGHFKGLMGRLIRKNGQHKLAIFISSIQQNVVIEVSATDVARRETASVCFSDQ